MLPGDTSAGTNQGIPAFKRNGRRYLASPGSGASMTNGWPWDKLLEMTELERGERDRKRRTDVLVLAAAIAAFLPAVYGMAKPFLTAVVLSAILAVAFNPLYSRMPNAARLLLFASPLAPASPLLIEHQ